MAPIRDGRDAYSAPTADNWSGVLCKGLYATADYAEIIVYPTALSAADRQNVINYLKTMWAF
jgi:hypothetical protein